MTDTVQIENSAPPSATPTLEEQYQSQKRADGSHPFDAPKASDGDRPTWLPEKFTSPEDMAKAYAELEKKQGEPPEENTNKPDDEPKDDAPKSPVEVAIAKASGEFETTGDISKETIDDLTKMGIDRAYIERYVEMAKAADSKYTRSGATGLDEQTVEDIMSVAGGRDGYGKMVEWMQSNLDGAEVDAFNATIDSNNPDVIKPTVAGYAARYQVANPQAPQLLQGATGGGPAVMPFNSVAQVKAAMSDPQYTQDPAYRAEVSRRIAVSNVL